MCASSDKTSQNPQANRLPPGQQLVGSGKWPFVGERQCLPRNGPWTLSLSGLIETPQTFTLEQLAELPQTEMITDIHCVTRWSKLDARFRGVTLKTLLDECQVESTAKFVSFIARSERRHSSSLPIDDAIEMGTMLATHFEDQPLPAEHGGPLRGVVPGKYFYKSVKWIETIEILAEDRLGYWEAETGYHNVADPWKEQRYIAPSITKREAAILIESKDFSNRDLRSIDVGSLDLAQLNASNALLRNANFESGMLAGANFANANLSNANFRNANLSQTNFQNADLEGADFSGADLRGADLTGCSLFGTSFCDYKETVIDNAAKLDRDTKIDRHALDALTDGQRQFLARFVDSI